MEKFFNKRVLLVFITLLIGLSAALAISIFNSEPTNAQVCSGSMSWSVPKYECQRVYQPSIFTTRDRCKLVGTRSFSSSCSFGNNPFDPQACVTVRQSYTGCYNTGGIPRDYDCKTTQQSTQRLCRTSSPPPPPPPAPAVCGNDALESGEQCDLGSNNGPPPSTCSLTCTINNVPPPPQCSDTADNDGDTLIDTNDPGCHTDGDENNPGTYDPTDDDETNVACTGDGCTCTVDGDCDNPLVCTDGTCSTPFCGDGVISGTETCDQNENCTADCDYAECVDTEDNDGDGATDDLDTSCDPGGGGGCTGGGCGTCTGYGCDDSEDDLEPDVWITVVPKVVNKGGSATAEWGTYSDFTLGSCTASANPPDTDWSGSVGASGSTSITPDAVGVVRYTISCTNTDDESDSAFADIIVPFIHEVTPL